MPRLSLTTCVHFLAVGFLGIILCVLYVLSVHYYLINCLSSSNSYVKLFQRLP